MKLQLACLLTVVTLTLLALVASQEPPPTNGEESVKESLPKDYLCRRRARYQRGCLNCELPSARTRLAELPHSTRCHYTMNPQMVLITLTVRSVFDGKFAVLMQSVYLFTGVPEEPAALAAVIKLKMTLDKEKKVIAVISKGVF